MGREDVWRIRDDRTLSWAAKLVWYTLESRGDDCRPSQATIAADCGISRRQVSRAIAELDKQGWLKIAPTVTQTKAAAPNSYMTVSPARHGVTDSRTPLRHTVVPPTPVSRNPYDSQAHKEEKGSVKEKCKKTSNDQLPLIDSDDSGDTKPANDGFDAFWAVYPRKVGKLGAKSCYAKAAKKADPRLIIAGAVRYRDDPNRADEFTKHPSTWLNKGCWDDEPLPARRSNGNDRLDKAAAVARKNRVNGQPSAAMTAFARAAGMNTTHPSEESRREITS